MKKMFVLTTLLVFVGVQAFADWYFDAGVGFHRLAYTYDGITESLTQFSMAFGVAHAPWERPIYLGATLDFGLNTFRESGGGESYSNSQGFFGITPNVIVFPWDFLSMSVGLQFLFGELNHIRTVAGVMKHFRISGNRFMGIGLNLGANIVGSVPDADFMIFAGSGMSIIARFVLRPLGSGAVHATAAADDDNESEDE